MTMTASMGGSSAASAPKASAVGGEPPMGQVVRAVMGKELRQNWVNLALVICLEFIIVCVAEWFRSGWLFDSRYGNGGNGIVNLLLFPAVQAAIPLGCAVAGLLLGVLQPLADRNFDLWAFLNHRPVPRWWLFLGRALSGLVLYFLATGLPILFALSVAPTKMGGRLFLWEFWLPPMADWMAGLVYYVAGLLVMERQARWYGSRIVPVAGAVAGSFLGMMVPAFWMAIAISVGLLAVYVAAAAGSGMSHGFTLRAPRWATAALGVVIAVGIVGVCALAVGSPLENALAKRDAVFHMRWGYDQLWTHEEGPTTGEFYTLMDNATLAKVVETSRWDAAKKQYVTLSDAWFDTAGRQIPEPAATDPKVTLNRAQFQPQPARAPVSFRDRGYRVQVMGAPIWQSKLENVWYWVPWRGVFYVYQQPRYESFASDEEAQQAWKHAVFLGAFGADGLQPQGKAQPFENLIFESGFNYGRDLVRASRALLVIDREKAALAPWFTAHADETILDVRAEQRHGDGPKESEWVLTGKFYVFTTQRVVKLDEGGHAVWSLSIPAGEDPRSMTFFDFQKVNKRVLLFEKQRPKGEGFIDFDRTYYTFDGAGQQIARQAIPTIHGSPRPFASAMLLPRGVRMVSRLEYRAGALFAGGGPVAALTGMFSLGMHGPFEPTEFIDEVMNGVEKTGAFWITAVPILLAYAAGAWALAWVYAKSMRARMAWAALALVFGPAAVLAFLALHFLPQWVRCPQCGKLRLRREERCAVCGAAWAHPESMGTEIWPARPV